MRQMRRGVSHGAARRPRQVARGRDRRGPARAHRAAASPTRRARWVEACNGSAQCSAACPEGINVRQWVSIERMRQRLAEREAERAETARRRFRTMSHSVRLLSSMQVPSEALARVTGRSASGRVDFVFYTGCNVLRTPHLVFNVMDILDALGVSLRGDGRARPLLRRLSFPRGRSRHLREGRGPHL